jgi:hypothetical protein
MSHFESSILPSESLWLLHFVKWVTFTVAACHLSHFDCSTLPAETLLQYHLAIWVTLTLALCQLNQFYSITLPSESLLQYHLAIWVAFTVSPCHLSHFYSINLPSESLLQYHLAIWVTLTVALCQLSQFYSSTLQLSHFKVALFSYACIWLKLYLHSYGEALCAHFLSTGFICLKISIVVWLLSMQLRNCSVSLDLPEHPKWCWLLRVYSWGWLVGYAIQLRPRCTLRIFNLLYDSGLGALYGPSFLYTPAASVHCTVEHALMVL